MVMLVYLSKEKKLKYVPIINSHAGMTLTPKQWIQTATNVFAYDVTGLLQRPGLVKFSLKSPGKSIVDCRNLTFNAKKQVRFKTIDGSHKTIEVEESENCSCETCSQGFTRAYFHHLLQHTPLLAQRFLVIHNVFFTQLHGIRA